MTATLGLPQSAPAGAGAVAAERAPDTVVVLDGDQRSALAAVRSLGRRGVRVVAADDHRPTLAGASRYCAGALVYPSPAREPARFLARLPALLAAHGCGLVLPMTDLTTTLLAGRREALAPARLPIAPPEALDALGDKWSLYRLARDCGLPVPATAAVPADELARGRTGGLAYPLVLKPARRTFDGARWETGAIHYLAGPADLRRAIATDPAIARIPYVAQEQVPGRGQGVFALYDRGAPVALFAHRRIREKPPGGGVSVLCESRPLDPRLVAVARTLLEAVSWHGVAMVEFKVTAEGRPYLIEVNPRFWGSLQLAVDAGVDFPWLLYRLARGEPAIPPAGYATPLRCRWVLGDLDWLYLRLRSREPLAARLRAVLDFVRPSPCRLRHEVNRLDDPRPFLHELRGYLSALGRAGRPGVRPARQA